MKYLSIVSPEINLNGKTYRSEPSVLPAKVNADSLSTRMVLIPIELNSGETIERYFIQVNVNTPINTSENTEYLRWEIEEIYSFTTLPVQPFNTFTTCYIPSETDRQKINIANGFGFPDNYIEEFEIILQSPEPWYEYARGLHYFNVFQYSLSEENYIYWENIEKVANQQGSIFDPPPAPISGNISNPADQSELVLGYFQVVQVDTVRTFVVPEDLDPVAPVDECSGQIGVASRCFTCSGERGATLIRPEYWGE
jgi:hypothetical protein